MPKFLTVVYTINNDEEFQKEKDALHKKFKPSKGEPWAITAMSLDHEIQRIHWIEEAVNSGDEEAIDAAIGFVGVGNINSLDELKS